MYQLFADTPYGPEQCIKRLSDNARIPFDPAMLSWPQGPKPFDGVWAPHWYNAVWSSTGFARPPADVPALPAELQKIADEARPYYERLKQHRL